ncbi:hypothetical protein GCM10010182_00450 [Actinomadura cremea]|nr:hypothetical protein GCM10010182_00450 [Actinomadura cremea]
MKPTSTDVRHQITAHLDRIRSVVDDELLPPLLLLGTSERVGSNWLSDMLRPFMDQHNEPFRQQLAAANPLSALATSPARLGHAARRLGPLGRYWLTVFTVGKHTPVRQVIKETNLLFALPNLLGLFPDSPAAVLTRSPLGVADSFRRGDLFRRWDYRARYRQITSVAAGGPYRVLVPNDDPADLVALVRLQVLNTLLLATALGDRHVAQIGYETSVLDPGTAWRTVADLAPELPAAAPSGSGEQAGVEQDFATTHAKTRLVAHLTAADANLVQAATATCLTAARSIADPSVVATAAGWLTGAHLYTLAAPPPAAVRNHPGKARLAPPPPAAESVPLRFVECSGTWWRNLLVSNADYAAFLTELDAAGLGNVHHGVHLLVCQMPHERGGGLQHDAANRRWTVSPGYEQRPAYWVTWIGAAAFAARHGAALPTRAELLTATAGDGGCLDRLPDPVRERNAAYRFGDVTPVTEPGLCVDAVHHLVGNLQVWCADGPATAPGPAVRWLHGAAWNTPATPREVHRPRHRHLTGCSRGVGIRLVARPGLAAVPPERIAAVLNAWIGGLDDEEPPSRPDERLIAALTGLAAHQGRLASQADGRLGAHVGADARPALAGQLNEPVAEPQPRQLVQRHELHAADRAGVGADLDVSGGAAHPAGLERHVHDVGVAAGEVVADVQQPSRFDGQAGLFPHLPDEGVGERLPVLDLSARERPGSAGVGVLVQQQDPAVLDQDRGDSDSDGCAHPGTVSGDESQ